MHLSQYDIDSILNEISCIRKEILLEYYHKNNSEILQEFDMFLNGYGRGCLNYPKKIRETLIQINKLNILQNSVMEEFKRKR